MTAKGVGAAPPPPGARPRSPEPPRPSLRRWLAILAAAAAAGAAVHAGILLRVREVAGPGSPAAAPPETAAESFVDARLDAETDFDVEIPLPSSPGAVAWDGRAFLVARRNAPGGLLRVTPAGGGRYRLEDALVREPEYRQVVSFGTLAWNGREIVGTADGAWFQSPHKDLFVVVDPSTLGIVRTLPAPPLLGALVWNGAGYWAATRRNTADAAEPAFLYRLDADLREVARFDAPAVGCQGLAWDGRSLWWADVFEDALLVLDIADTGPAVRHRQAMRSSYLSGLAFDTDHVWVSDYDADRLRRLRDPFRAAWTGVAETPPAGLEGAWIAAEEGGADGWHIAFRGGLYEVAGGDPAETFAGRYVLDTGAAPAVLSLTVESSSGMTRAGSSLLAICRLEGNAATIAAGAAARPDTFAPADGVRVFRAVRR